MELDKEITQRKLEMVKLNQQLEQQKARLTAQLQQTNMALLELEVELKVLDRWELKLNSNEEEEKC